MDYDDYSYADYSYDEESYGYDSYDDDISYHDYDKNEIIVEYDGKDHTDNSGIQDQEYFYDYAEDFTPQDDDSIVRKPYDWDIYDSDDDVEYTDPNDNVKSTHHSVIKSPSRSSINSVNKLNTPSSSSNKPSSELAFDRAVTYLFNEDINGPIATFFIKNFGRRHIDDMIHPDTFGSNLSSSHLNKSEKDLLSTLCICNRVFINFYGSPIKEDWSNVSSENFDHIGEEYGFIPINRDVTCKPSSDAFEYIINKFFEQDMDSPIVKSLLEYTKGSRDVDLVLDMIIK